MGIDWRKQLTCDSPEEAEAIRKAGIIDIEKMELPMRSDDMEDLIEMAQNLLGLISTFDPAAQLRITSLLLALLELELGGVTAHEVSWETGAKLARMVLLVREVRRKSDALDHD